MHYDTLRHFADSWGLVFLFFIFLVVFAFLFRPGARRQAKEASMIPLRDHDEGNTK